MLVVISPGDVVALIADLPVGPLLAGATVVIPHGLTSLGLPIAPTQALPDRNTDIVVVTADTTSITFRNDGIITAIAFFRVMHIHSEQAQDSLALLGWQGAGATQGNGQQGSVLQVGSFGGAVPYTDATAPAPVTVATIPILAGSLDVVGRTLRIRASGNIVASAGAPGGQPVAHAVFFGGMLIAVLPFVPPDVPPVAWTMDLEVRHDGPGIFPNSRLSVSRILKTVSAGAIVTVESTSPLVGPDLSVNQNLDFDVTFAVAPVGDGGQLDVFVADIGG